MKKYITINAKKMNKVATNLLIYWVNCAYYTENKVWNDRYIHGDYKTRYIFAILIFVILRIEKNKQMYGCYLIRRIIEQSKCGFIFYKTLKITNS